MGMKIVGKFEEKEGAILVRGGRIGGVHLSKPWHALSFVAVLYICELNNLISSDILSYFLSVSNFRLV